MQIGLFLLYLLIFAFLLESKTKYVFLIPSLFYSSQSLISVSCDHLPELPPACRFLSQALSFGGIWAKISEQRTKAGRLRYWSIPELRNLRCALDSSSLPLGCCSLPILLCKMYCMKKLLHNTLPNLHGNGVI